MCNGRVWGEETVGGAGRRPWGAGARGLTSFLLQPPAPTEPSPRPTRGSVCAPPGVSPCPSSSKALAAPGKWGCIEGCGGALGLCPAPPMCSGAGRMAGPRTLPLVRTSRGLVEAPPGAGTPGSCLRGVGVRAGAPGYLGGPAGRGAGLCPASLQGRPQAAGGGVPEQGGGVKPGQGRPRGGGSSTIRGRANTGHARAPELHPPSRPPGPPPRAASDPETRGAPTCWGGPLLGPGGSGGNPPTRGRPGGCGPDSTSPWMRASGQEHGEAEGAGGAQARRASWGRQDIGLRGAGGGAGMRVPGRRSPRGGLGDPSSRSPGGRRPVPPRSRG